MELTPDRKATFLAELARHGIVARAARAASPHSERGCIMSFRDERQRDEGFGAEWAEALEVAKGAVESELHRRGVEGWDEPIFGGKYKETIVGTVRKYSDRLLELRVKALLPHYRESHKVELDGGLEVKNGTLAQAVKVVAAELANDMRAAAREEIDGTSRN